jgi:DNA repair protein RecO (recombination protein O)
MDDRAVGIILRTFPATETSLVVRWLTPEQGRISTIAKGARRSKSPFAGKLDLFYRARFSFQRSSRTDLHTLREVQVESTIECVRSDLKKLWQASYLAHLIELVTEPDTPVPEIFSIFESFVACLPDFEGPTLVLSFEAKLLDLLGLAPVTNRLNPGCGRIFEILGEFNPVKLKTLRISNEQLADLRLFLGHEIGSQWGRLPQGRNEALQF